MTISPDYTVLIQIANFLVLIFLMNIVVYKPVRAMLARRREKLDGLNRDIRSSRQAADEKASELQQGLAQARSAGQEKKDALTDEALGEEKKILAEINDKAAQKLEAMRARIDKDVAEAEAKLSQEIAAYAQAIGEKILGRALQ